MGAPSKGKGKGKTSGKGKGKGQRESAKSGGKGDKWVVVNTTEKARTTTTCLVTGASGYLAGHLVKLLLSVGYKVRGTVRNASDESKVGHLKRMYNASNLELVEADLLGGAEPFAKAMEGVTHVYHTASPFALSCKDAQKDFVDPALKGTEAVVGAAVKAGVKRVVVTSSCAAIGPPQPWFDDAALADKEKEFSEEDWNTTSTLEKGPYRYSKRVAEEKAWELVKGTNTELAVICPSFVIGPALSSRADATSIQMIQNMLNGTMKEKGCAGGTALGVVDVRDCAAAHLKAMETAEANGKRFITGSSEGVGQLEMADMLRNRFKAYPLPTEGKEILYKAKYSNARAKDILKVKFRPPAVSLGDMAASAVALGIIEKKFVKKAAKVGKVSDVQPDTKGLNLLLKIVKVVGEEETKNGMKIKEVAAGDASGMVTLRLAGDEIAPAEVGKIVSVQNATVKMVKGHVRLQIGKWGKISQQDGEDVVPNEKNDVSATEYELVES